MSKIKMVQYLIVETRDDNLLNDPRRAVDDES